ncbi:flagellar basal body-associated FliL family protein [Methylocaldum sp.]|uniref:flagellar basal body-associated FliL family protein n=1 Tax=Methylocaldum sp. TaxID=1969727 RepID=UPI002D6924D5|nr:flagellar basal body-associated FliL family protein [Methylocaldum sp.]HYE34889.1 flagellar basal body-associated FliL family protein [Methylocaldum sp.]
MSGEEGEGGDGGVEYLPLASVLVNLEGKRHYLRADIQLLVDGKENAEKIKMHMPPIRHALIMLFSNRNPEQLSAADEREKLRQAALQDVTKTLEKYGASEGLKDLFFTDFLVQ